MAIPRVPVKVLGGQNTRRNRYPQHTFQIRHRPFEITPFCIAPVLPGETLKNFMFQSRVVTDPIKNPIVGWWCDYYWFYVKLRDLDGRDTYTSMMLDPSTSVAALRSATQDIWAYTADDDMDFVNQCLKRVTEEYFRDQGETWNGFVVTAGRPAAQINTRDWTDSVIDKTTGLDPDDPSLTIGGDGLIKGSEIDATLRQYMFLREQNLVTMSWEDYLAQYGVRATQLEDHRPELLRYIREWSYPANTIDPTNGTPRSAVSWVVQERADKDRFFKEPGFLFGVCVVRPKVYKNLQTGSAACMLDNAYAWLPAALWGDKGASLKEFAVSNGPLQSTTNPYVVDVKDAFLYGDQFVNFAITGADLNSVALPNAALSNKRYPSSADVDALFASASPANQIRQDGIAHFTIAGRIEDTSPTV